MKQCKTIFSLKIKPFVWTGRRGLVRSHSGVTLLKQWHLIDACVHRKSINEINYNRRVGLITEKSSENRFFLIRHHNFVRVVLAKTDELSGHDKVAVSVNTHCHPYVQLSTSITLDHQMMPWRSVSDWSIPVGRLVLGNFVPQMNHSCVTISLDHLFTGTLCQLFHLFRMFYTPY